MYEATRTAIHYIVSLTDYYQPASCHYKYRETFHIYDSIKCVSIEATSQRLELVGEGLLTTKFSYYFKLREVLFSTAMLDLNCNEGTLWLTAQPIDGTDTTGAIAYNHVTL